MKNKIWKKTVKMVAGVLCCAMLLGGTAFAADSPTAENVHGGGGSDPQNMSISVSSLVTEGGDVYVGQMRISADYSKSGRDDLVLVVSISNTTNGGPVGTLLDDINEVLPEGFFVDARNTFDVTLRDSENRIYQGEEAYLYDFTFGVGNKYDGLTAAVYVYDGSSLTGYAGTVVNGKLTIEDVPVTGMLCFYVATPDGFVS